MTTATNATHVVAPTPLPTHEPCYTADITWLNIILGALLIVAGILSFAPQWLAIVRARSSDGISAGFCFLSCVSGFTSLLNSIVLQIDQVACCFRAGFPFGRCEELLLTQEQLGASPLCQFITFSLWFAFFPVDARDDERRRHWLVGRLLFATFLAVFVGGLSAAAAALMVSLGRDSHAVRGYGDALGVVAALATLVQYLPQLYFTFRRRAAGSLSLVALSIQTPGMLVIVVYQAVWRGTRRARAA